MSSASTAYLLTCAAIGVAGAIVLTAANWLSTALFVAFPFVSVVLIGLWMLPAVVAMRLLERPLAALLVGLISGLVLAAASFDLFSFPWWGQALFVLLTLASTLAGVALGIVIADALRRAGVARVARRHPTVRG